MTALTFTNRRRQMLLAISALCAILYVVWVILAPAESTIGDRIKTVIVHVTWTWVGMAALALAGGLGAVQALWPQPRLARVSYVVAWIGFVAYVLGAAISLLAQQQTWGAIVWQEPRTSAALQMTAAGIIVLALGELIPQPRLRGVLYAALTLFLLWGTAAAEPVMHPVDPVSASSSATLQWSFYGPALLLAVLLSLLGWLWLTADAQTTMPRT